MATKDNAKLAVLIDADNAQASVIQELLAEVSRYGTATIKRAYGDWTTQNLKGWKEVLHTMAIQPVQQFAYTSGKNATDSALIIDAMDVLHADAVDGFCLVSSDSDFTRLATRIREAGLVVYGFGQRKTPEPFVAACDKFIYTEILRAKPEEHKGSRGGRRSRQRGRVAQAAPHGAHGARRHRARRRLVVALGAGQPAHPQPPLVRPAQLRRGQARRTHAQADLPGSEGSAHRRRLQPGARARAPQAGAGRAGG